MRMFILIFITCVLTYPTMEETFEPLIRKSNKPITTICVIKNGTYGNIEGTIRLQQKGFDARVEITGIITGLKEGPHGIHIHEFGDISEGCTETGHHYNPQNTQHGGPSDKIRHVGDLGNIISDRSSTAKINETDKLVKLYGIFSVIGRSIMIHEHEDDLGKGGDASRHRNGNAGKPVACCVIVHTNIRTDA